MMQAVKRFDPDRGFRLTTYAMWRIGAAMQEYILHSWSLVKIGAAAYQKQLFFNLRKLKNQTKALEESDPTPEHVTDIAERLNVPEKGVVSIIPRTHRCVKKEMVNGRVGLSPRVRTRRRL